MEVIDLLKQENVTCILENAEEYCILGHAPFASYFTPIKEKSYNWTENQIKSELSWITHLSHSYQLTLGGKKIGLCHFANDVRCDYQWDHSVWNYQEHRRKKEDGYQQFLYTNSDAQKLMIEHQLKNSPLNEALNGYLSTQREPLFNGNMINTFDAIIQGHSHFKLYERFSTTEIYTLRAVAMAYEEDPIDQAYYVILREQDQGFHLEQCLVPYDRPSMVKKIRSTSCPDPLVRIYTQVTV